MKAPILYRIESSPEQVHEGLSRHCARTANFDLKARARDELQAGQELEAEFNFRAAEECYLESLHILKVIGEEHSVDWAIIARSLSLLHLKRRNLSLAHWYAGRAVAAALSQASLDPEAVKVIAFYGAFLFQMGKYNRAVRYLRHAYLQAKRTCRRSLICADIADLLVDAYSRVSLERRSASCIRLSRRLRAAACS